MDKKAVVFGATGLVGRDLVAELLDNSSFDKVIMVVRKPFPVLNPRIELLQLADFSKLISFKSELQGEAYFCCIGSTIKKAGSKEAFRHADLEIPCYIAELAVKLAIPSLVIISSIGASVYSSSFYLRTKGEMENLVRRIYNGNLKIVRPSLLRGDRTEFRMAEMISLALMKIFDKVLTGLAVKYKSIRTKDVARAMVKSINLPPDKVYLESDELQKMATAN